MPLAFSAVLPQLVSAKSLQGNLVDAETVEPFETLFRCRLVTPPPIGERSIVTSVSVCLSVCVFVRDHISGTTRPIFTNFLCLLSMAVARSCSGGVVIRYVLPVFTDNVIFAHKPGLLDVAAQLRRSAHAALGLAIKCAEKRLQANERTGLLFGRLN